jgi:hypothetical protein
MTDPEQGRHGSRPRWSGDAGARILFMRVRQARPARDDLPSRLEAGLRAALEVLAADPELARLLTVAPYLDVDPVALDAQREWIGRLGKLLDAAAASDPGASRESSFLAPFLIGGVRFQIGRLVLNGEADDLPRLLPSLLKGLLAYYFKPGESPLLTAAVPEMAGLELPPFDGPLVAFDPAPQGAPGRPVYLGGDLHRVHPDVAEPGFGQCLDGSLDEARIVLGEREQENLEVTAVDGVWCMALYGEQVDSAPYLTLWDTEGRMRTRILLPPARLMIGLAHFWLPSVPPPPGLG